MNIMNPCDSSLSLSFPSWSLMTSVRNEGWKPKIPKCRSEKLDLKGQPFSHFVTKKYTKKFRRSLENDPGLSFIKKSWGLNIWKWSYLSKFLFFPVGPSFFFVGNDETSQPVRLRSLSYRTVSKKEKQDCFEGSWCIFSLPKRYNFMKFANRCFFWLFWPILFAVNLSYNKKSIQEA